MTYFCVAELLANVTRHSGASSAAVRIHGDATELRIVVEDNGSGGAQAGNGSGLIGLRDRLGMLDGQRMRAARVVLDIGVHLEKPRPDGNGTWDADYALDFMRGNVNMSDEFVKFEVNRYLGWPGQAPSYKVGERIWLQAREDARTRLGSAFDLKSFHRSALDLGSIGLDPLQAALARIS